MKHFLLFVALYATNASCQLQVSDLQRFHIGLDSFSSRKRISQLFSANGSLVKSETFSSVYKQVFESATFNYCDNATYEFLYVDDKLVNVDINMLYYYSKETFETFKYFKALGNILSSIRERASFQLIPSISHVINEKRIKDKIEDSLNYYYQHMGEDQDLSKSLGYNTYLIKNNDFDKKFLILTTGQLEDVNFKRIGFNINLQLTSAKYSEYFEKYSWGTSKYINDATEIELSLENGIYKLPVNLNGVMTLTFILDLGASDVSLSPDVFLVLYRSGTISDSDFIGTKTYRFADGSTAKSSVFNLKTLKVGGIELKNVRASVSNSIDSPLLLGQSALKKLSSYKIDNQNRKLIIF